jgi:hypothetical protein
MAFDFNIGEEEWVLASVGAASKLAPGHFALGTIKDSGPTWSIASAG